MRYSAEPWLAAAPIAAPVAAPNLDYRIRPQLSMGEYGSFAQCSRGPTSPVCRAASISAGCIGYSWIDGRGLAPSCISLLGRRVAVAEPMAFKKILCPVDFSPGSQQAMRVAVRLANEADAELMLVHVWHLPPIASTEEATFPADTIELMIRDEERGLADASLMASKLGAKRVTTKFLTGVPWDQIVETLRDPAIGLVVLGAQGRTGFERILLGSVTEKVVRHAPCPVLAVRTRGELTAFNHVLCPVDFSESSRQAVALAAELASPGGAGIALLHAIDVPVTYSGEPPIASFFDDYEKESTRMLEKWARDLRAKVSVPVSILSKVGSPGKQTLAVLDDDKTFDLVALGSHGRTGIRRVLLGSVAEKIVRHAPCSVLVARARSS